MMLFALLVLLLSVPAFCDLATCEDTVQATVAGADPASTTSISCSSIQGPIPATISTLTALESIFLFGFSEGGITGTIPESLYTMTQLTRIQVIFHEFSGTLSSSVGGLTNLNTLFLIGFCNNDLSVSCGLTGSVPDELMQLTSMTELELTSNRLEGTLPSGFESWTALEGLWLGDNDFSGPLPVLSGLSSLAGLDLSFNAFNGTIPEHYGDELLALTSLTLMNNDLTSTIPSSLSQLAQLNVLGLGCNPLDPPFPAFIEAIIGSDAFSALGNDDSVFCGESVFIPSTAPSMAPSESTAMTLAPAALTAAALSALIVMLV